MTARTSTRKDVHGWVVLDKPSGMNSTHAVSRLKRIFNAKKAGHAGTLDPLATGILPIAFGEATKTVPFVQDGEKAFSDLWGWYPYCWGDRSRVRVCPTFRAAGRFDLGR